MAELIYRPAHLVDRLEIKLDEDQTKDLTLWIDQKKEAIDIARSAFVQRHERYLYNWDDFVTFNRKGPWEGSSNLHMPLTAIMVKTYHARLYNIFSSDNTVQYTGREGKDDELAATIKMLRDWYLWDYINGYKGIRGFAREVFYDTATVGFGIGMKDWYTKMRKVIDVEPKELQREMADAAPQVAERQQGAQVMETNEETDGKRMDMTQYKEVQKILTFFEGSRVRAVPFEQAYFPNFIPESNDLDFPSMVMVEVEMSVSDIALKVKRGEWDKENAMKVIEEGAVPFSSERAERIRKEKDKLTGWSESAMLYDKSPRRIQYAFATYDIDDDMIDEEIIVTRSSRGTILKTTFLDRVSRSGMRPLFKFDCFSKPRQAYSRGVPEYMYPLNEEMDQSHNMRQDYLALQTCPFGTYRSGSSLKNQPIRIAPGKFIPTEETTDMKVLNFQTNAVVLGQEEDRLWHYAERLAGVSSLSQGIVPQNVGPTRSTSGVVAMLQQMDKEFKPIIDQNAMQWKKLEKMLMDDLDFRIDPAVKMRVLGAKIEDFMDPAAKLTAQDQTDIVNRILQVNAQFDIRIDVANVIRSDEVFRSEATTVLQMLTAPGLAQQLGIVGPKALLKGYGDWLKAYGKDPADYIDIPPFVGKPMSFYQELQICYQEQVPPMAMQDEHEVKAQQLQQWLQEPLFLEGKAKGSISQNADFWIQKAAQKHMVIAGMMQQQRALPNPSGENQQDMTQVLAGQDPKQEANYKTPEPPAERTDDGAKSKTGRSSAGRSEGRGTKGSNGDESVASGR